ncbi:hypothetical protein [Luteimonas sp. 3794]|uniref:hypothetical protein n=1 Tax=Luteimonas sp. 3794 TaxID=2817730 RepID=UPI0028615C41|nr:hypothetical protein [Luteimonas sp. 3794]MDR6990273.1 hypothetical protein [Luteimonas sp. 3794]
MRHLWKGAGRALLVAALVSGMTGCGGTGAPAREQTLTLELDGKPLAFNAGLSANDPPAGETVHFVTVGGHLDDDPMSPGFDFQLVSPGVALGTYSSDSAELHANYYVQTGPGNTTVYTTDRHGARFTMTLTEMDADGVAGTFSGALRLLGAGDDGPVMTVRNGRFSARYNGR